MRTNISSGDPFEDIYGYSRAVRVGDHVHVSGTTAQEPFVEGCDTYVQAKNALDIIEQALVDVGASFADVVRTVTYVTDIADLHLAAWAHLEAFGDIRPTATIVEVSALDDPARTIEIEVYAICSTPSPG
ncbi:MAG: RidA family protein [Acidimicrobiia bacterium]|nr:RidA family protein [Acidimicrobiia bacterium]